MLASQLVLLAWTPPFDASTAILAARADALSLIMVPALLMVAAGLFVRIMMSMK